MTELKALFAADQADREGWVRHGTLSATGIQQRDRERRRRVEELIGTGQLRSAQDYFHAALIFQHGESLDDYWRAHELALKAAELGDKRGRRLAAMALDRWLVQQGKPQKFGTQFSWNGQGWEAPNVDPETTDAERAQWDVPPVEEQAKEIVQHCGEPGPPVNLPLR